MTFILRLFAFSFLMVSGYVSAVGDEDYLPRDTRFNPNITSPTEALGAEVGEWHVRHDQLANYMQLLAAQSDRVSIVETGRTHENRPLYLLAFSSPENQKNLAAIQAKHINNLGKSASADDPLILWMGYSVHGNEASGSNAALLVAYYLAAGESQKIDELLNNNLVLLDPSLNPDGLSRFAQWANMHRGNTLVADPQHREHKEAWPSGRTNHYWFDLNRDWLLLTHPESRARIAQFHQWRPHVLTDFHEMGSNSTYFFQPGIPSRKNPWTPRKNVELTTKLGNFHAAALDKTKQLYFSGESYDDFYYGKGSTYPDSIGSIGILFEQASSRGHVQDTVNGELRFSDTIQNQVTTTLSTFEGALANKKALLDYQVEFVQQTNDLIKDDDLAGYILQEKLDKTRFAKMLSIFKAHKIEYWPLSKNTKVDNQTFEAQSSVFVPLDQAQYRLIKSIFSTRKSFDDNTFYDVSNWNLPLAFNIQYTPVSRAPKVNKQSQSTSQAILPELQSSAYAYAFSWDDYNAPKLLQRLLASNIKVKVAGDAFFAKTSQGGMSFSAGAVIVPTALAQPDNLVAILEAQSVDLGISVHSISSGLTTQGIDIGSRKMLNVSQPKVLLVGGKGTSQYEVGEVWHYLDQHLDMPVSVTDMNELQTLNLENYTHMIWVQGSYKNVADRISQNLDTWLRNGGVLIGQKSAVAWFSNNNWLKVSVKTESDVQSAFATDHLSYKDKDSLAAKQRVAGAVYETQLDLSHPLAFGFHSETLPVFRNSAIVLRKPVKPFITAAFHPQTSLMAGYTAQEIQEQISGSAAVVAHNVGKGKVIAFANNVNFRGVWYGTSRLMSNAIFMAPFIKAQG
ncbi:M14 metallopeptidase family protein [Paraglaciecola sp. 2405UD69-4]|uniref:M14 metallopeptidase family protein n=1 Tax=Paraglaciecola sp. 2405UD69-4 TaxID=3391836 RepID=UPI0039C8EFB0